MMAEKGGSGRRRLEMVVVGWIALTVKMFRRNLMALRVIAHVQPL